MVSVPVCSAQQPTAAVLDAEMALSRMCICVCVLCMFVRSAKKDVTVLPSARNLTYLFLNCNSPPLCWDIFPKPLGDRLTWVPVGQLSPQGFPTLAGCVEGLYVCHTLLGISQVFTDLHLSNFRLFHGKVVESSFVLFWAMTLVCSTPTLNAYIYIVEVKDVFELLGILYLAVSSTFCIPCAKQSMAWSAIVWIASKPKTSSVSVKSSVAKCLDYWKWSSFLSDLTIPHLDVRAWFVQVGLEGPQEAPAKQLQTGAHRSGLKSKRVVFPVPLSLPMF